MTTLKRAVTLKHQASIDDSIDEVHFEEGESVTVLQAWKTHALCKSASGDLFNIPTELLHGLEGTEAES